MADMELKSRLESAARLIGAARHVAVLSGAGISAESGLPTFRGPDGLWRGLDPMQLATPEAFERDPDTVAHAGLYGPAGTVLPRLVDAVRIQELPVSPRSWPDFGELSRVGAKLQYLTMRSPE